MICFIITVRTNNNTLEVCDSLNVQDFSYLIHSATGNSGGDAVVQRREFYAAITK
jgi:hypothetical protein